MEQPCLIKDVLSVLKKALRENIAYIFDADMRYVSKLAYISPEKTIRLNKLLKRTCKLSDIIDKSTLCNIAHDIFFLCGDEDDIGIRDMHASFISQITDKYDGDVDLYAKEVKKRCLTCGMGDIGDYLEDEFSDLQRYIDPSTSENDDDQ